MNKTGNNSNLARISAGLDKELAAIFDQVEAALRPENDHWAEASEAAKAEPPLEASEELDDQALSPADLLDEEILEDLDMDLARINAPPFSESGLDEADWLPPGLLGEPERPAGLPPGLPGEPEKAAELSPELRRELSRLIEAAVEKGVAAALAKLKS